MLEKNGGEYRPYRSVPAGELITQPERFYGNKNLNACAIFVAEERVVKVYDPRNPFIGIDFRASYIVEEVGFIQDLGNFIAKIDEKRLRAYVVSGVSTIVEVKQRLNAPEEKYAQFYGAVVVWRFIARS